MADTCEKCPFDYKTLLYRMSEAERDIDTVAETGRNEHDKLWTEGVNPLRKNLQHMTYWVMGGMLSIIIQLVMLAQFLKGT